MSNNHIPVMLKEILEAFNELKISCFVDCTLGAAGHSLAMLQNHPEIETFIGIDQDPLALEIAKKKLKKWQKKLILIQGNFSNLEEYLAKHKIEKVEGILFDFGVSSMQFDTSERGFSFQAEGPLDMRMDPESELTAYEIVNEWSEEELGKIFRKYGEEKSWRRAARGIVFARQEKAIKTTKELAEILLAALPKKKKGKINPLTLIFQALRIAVNKELENIEKVLDQAIRTLNPGGRIAAISFHSLEDRLVKRAFKYAATDIVDTTSIGQVFLTKEPTVRIITRKPLVASLDEVEQNPRSRSAKLRVVEKLGEKK